MAIHSSAMGRAVDMASLSSQHEKVRAVGNMNVNARGDVIDSFGRVITDNATRVKGNYSNTVNNSQDNEESAHLTPGTHAIHEVKMASNLTEDTIDLSDSEQELFEELDSEEDEEK